MRIELDNTGFYTPLQLSILSVCEARFIYWKAGRRSGKTTGGRRWILDQGYYSTRLDLPCFWVSPTIEMARKVFDLFVKEYKPVLKAWNLSRRQVILRNGREIFFLGCDRPETIEGSGLWACVFDEVRHVKTDRVWYESISPMLADAAEVGGGKALVISTPISRLHWFSQLVDRAQKGEEGNNPDIHSAFVTTTLESGCISEDEINRARATLPADIFRRNYEAVDTALEGIIYREYSPDRHYLTEQGIKGIFTPYVWYCGLDYGSTEGHPTVFTVICQDSSGFFNAVWDERYLPGANQAEVEQTAHELKEKYPIQHFFTDHNRPDFAHALRAAGHRVRLARKGPDSVAWGIGLVRVLLHASEKGIPHLFFNSDKISKLVGEIENYCYKDGTEVPNKAAGGDDGCDSMRYCLTMIADKKRKGRIRDYE